MRILGKHIWETLVIAQVLLKPNRKLKWVMNNRVKSIAYKKKARGIRGSQMAEFAPALMIILICFFFPMVDMLSLAVSYGLCMVLNYNQVHEASLLPWNSATSAGGVVQKAIPDQWLNGMGRFVKIVGYPQTNVTYRTVQTGGGKNPDDKIVIVSTTVVCNPFLSIPLPVLNVPGLNGPMTFTVVSERPMENPDYGQ